MTAKELIILELSSQADFLLPFTYLSLKTGMKVTASAPDVRIKNMKSGTVNATLYAATSGLVAPKPPAKNNSRSNPRRSATKLDAASNEAANPKLAF